MSIISSAAHSVVSYDPKSSKPFQGQRLAKVTYKTVTNKEDPMFGIKRPSMCVSLHTLTTQEVTQNVAALAPYIVEYLHGVQDKIVRERVDAGAKHITAEEISIAGICEYLESNNESGRLTKESVSAWFNEVIAEPLAVTLADRLGVSDTPTDAESAKILAVVDAFKGKVAALAGGKTAYEPRVCTSLLNALNLAPAGDVLATRFTLRLEKMIQESKAGDELLELL